MTFNKVIKRIFLLVAVCFVVACSAEPRWFEPSGKAIGVPKDLNLSFEDYIAESRKNIEQVISEQRFTGSSSPYVNSYSIKEVVDMRTPFQLPEQLDKRCSDQKEGSNTGFLLIHGLTDSPYLLKGLADTIHERKPCAVIRAVLLPGHGTVVGDTLNMKHQDWQAVSRYGVNSLEKMADIKDIYIIGFSVGAALAIKHAHHNVKENTKVKGLILLSAALKAKNNFAWLSRFLTFFKPWLDIKEERDAARYSSFSTNAGAQFYQLTQHLLDEKLQLDIPVLMAISADDATVKSESARAFFCHQVLNSRKQLLWYQGFSDPIEEDCQGIIDIKRSEVDQKYQGINYQYANLSHTGLPVSPADKHYGVEGKYRDCKYYEQKGDDTLWLQCVRGNEKVMFAEKNIINEKDILKDNVWRRTTFNKDYLQLVDKILCFTDSHCSLH